MPLSSSGRPFAHEALHVKKPKGIATPVCTCLDCRKMEYDDTGAVTARIARSLSVVVLTLCWNLGCKSKEAPPPSATQETPVAAQQLLSVEVAVHGQPGSPSWQIDPAGDPQSLWTLCKEGVEAVSVRGSRGTFAHASCLRQNEQQFDIVANEQGEVTATLSRRTSPPGPAISVVAGVTDIFSERPRSSAGDAQRDLRIVAGDQEWSHPLLSTARGNETRRGKARAQGSGSKPTGVTVASLVSEKGFAWDQIAALTITNDEGALRLDQDALAELESTLRVKRNRKGQIKVSAGGARQKQAIEMRGVRRLDIEWRSPQPKSAP